MSRKVVVNRVVLWFLAVTAFSRVEFDAFGDTAWIVPVDGLWREPLNWSFGAPGVHQPVTHIANIGSKIVTVDAATPATNLVVQRLNLSGPSGTNRLLLTDVELQLRSSLEMRAGSELYITNSTLQLRGGVAGSSLNLNAGEIRLQSGLLASSNVSTRVGLTGRGVMFVEGGASMLEEVLVGVRVGSFGSIYLSGGILSVTKDLDIGDDLGSRGEIVVTGGELVATGSNFVTRIGDDGEGSMVISNGVVRLDDVSVARHVTGTLHLAGGTLFAGDVSLGRFPNSTGMVFQTGGEYFSSDVVRVGHEGRGELTISGGMFVAEGMNVAGATNTASGLLTLSGGTILLSSNLLIGGTVSTGEVVLAGGTLVITNLNQNGTLEIAQGTATLSGSDLTVDQLTIASNTAQLIFEKGILGSASTVISNGLPFVVGDGTNSATFHLRGGTHYFADGLMISSNAILSGCGTIIGNVINQGTIATNCLTAPVLVQPAHSAGAFSFQFNSQSGALYTVEYKSVLAAGSWTFLLSTNGTGGPMLVEDPAPADRARFYRVKVQ